MVSLPLGEPGGLAACLVQGSSQEDSPSPLELKASVNLPPGPSGLCSKAGDNVNSARTMGLDLHIKDG